MAFYSQRKIPKIFYHLSSPKPLKKMNLSPCDYTVPLCSNAVHIAYVLKSQALGDLKFYYASTVQKFWTSVKTCFLSKCEVSV